MSRPADVSVIYAGLDRSPMRASEVASERAANAGLRGPGTQQQSGERNVTSTIRRCVLQAAVGPQGVDATFETERSQVGLEDLAVVPDLGHDVVGEVR
ncbi:hypothetical protein BH24ACT5_BH24ACT5_30730 [soil metagenome]